MTCSEMVCHLSDSFRSALGERVVSDASTIFSRSVLKWLALASPIRWPHGVRGRPEVDPKLKGTHPTTFAADLAELLRLIERFASTPADFAWAPHPSFGSLTRRQRMRHGYLHLDHHLRQFGE
jgi:hypothetical protein